MLSCHFPFIGKTAKSKFRWASAKARSNTINVPTSRSARATASSNARPCTASRASKNARPFGPRVHTETPDQPCVQIDLAFGCRSGFLFPSPLRRFGDQPLLQGRCRHPDITDFPVHHRLDPLQIGQKTPLRDSGYVRADAALLLGLAAAPNNAALHGALAG